MNKHPESGALPRVVVLMSTFNGERFVGEQLRSILAQLPLDGSVMIRDDGSSDGTVDVVAGVGDPRVSVVRGQNLGFGASFLTLLAMVPADADMVMFADQDDVWIPQKVERAWHCLKSHAGIPALYGSVQMLVDENLRPLHQTPPWPRGPSFAGALTENLITGCTAAINRPAMELLKRSGVPEGVVFHDWWCYLVISAFGTVIVDDTPTVLYRQHGENEIGHGAGWLGRYLRIARFLLRHDWVDIMLSQANALWFHYGRDLDPAARTLLAEHFDLAERNPEARWRLIFSARRWRQTFVSDLLLRMLLALHRLHLWPRRRQRA